MCGGRGGDTFMPWWEQSPLNEKVQKKTKKTPMETSKERERENEREREKTKKISVSFVECRGTVMCHNL